MFGALGAAGSPEQGAPDRSVTWENIYDDGARAELLGYRSDLMRLDECGPSGDVPSVL
jgi:hypothetical protein